MSQALLDWKHSTPPGADALPDVVDELDCDTSSRVDMPGSAREDTPRRATTHPDRLSREQVIDEIIANNPTASAEFLCDFSEDRLRLYLDRLRSSQSARGRESRWLRPGDSPAIMSHERML